MIKSMTAFADGEIAVDNLVILCELRSVNHRYSDISIKLPERLKYAESEVRRLISEKLKRGKIDCTINYKKQASAQTFSVNTDIIQKLLAATTQIEAAMSNPRSFSALEVLAFPGVQQETETDKQLIQQAILDMLESTVDNLLKTRSREGQQLAELLIDRSHKMRQLIESAKLRMPDVLSNVRTKLTARVAELVADPNFERLEQELALMTHKMDVDEELDRLETHVTELLHSLKQAEPVGRRLDFLMQEMNREANTLGSKSADREMTQISIELKVLIEQMREQIQNIE
jgi:uncharacterized protein (TIGR00255 family)